MPALLFWIMLIVQYGLWFHAKQVASAAAAEAVDAAQVPGGTAEEAEQAARSFLAQSGNFREIAVTVVPTRDDLTVRVEGQAPRLVPGFVWRVASVVQAPLERFVPEPERSG
jgi:Flp pilus assembly protein TadG